MKVLRDRKDIAGEVRSGFSAVGKRFALRAIVDQPSGPILDFTEKELRKYK